MRIKAQCFRPFQDVLWFVILMVVKNMGVCMGER